MSKNKKIDNIKHYYIWGVPGRGKEVYEMLKSNSGLKQLYGDTYLSILENEKLLLYIDTRGTILALDKRNDKDIMDLVIGNWIELKLSYIPKDKEFVWAYNSDNPCIKSLIFYDAKHNCSFTGVRGKRDGYCYIHYAPFEGELPKWAKVALNKLED